MTGTATASTNGTPRHMPSVSELQAALLAARNGQFAASGTAPASAPPGPPRALEHLTTPPGEPAPRPAPPVGAGIWLLGTHGGSGVQCLVAVLPGTRCAGKAWPTPATSRQPVVLVCRGNQRGLSSAQEYARAYRDSDLAAGLQLLGVIVSADAPGRTPPPLRRLERLLSGAVPVLGHVPWDPTWRLGPLQAGQAESLPWVAKLAQALATVVGAGAQS